MDALESKEIEELAAMCEKKGCPLEEEPEKDILLERLRAVVVWEHLPLEELRKEAEALGVLTGDMENRAQLPEPGSSNGKAWQWGSNLTLERDEKRELVKRLIEQLSFAPRLGGGTSHEDPRAYARRIEKCYETLQLGPEAGTEELKRAYKELARKLHPDKNPGAEEQVTAEFQAVTEAYEALTEHLRAMGY